MQSYVRSNKYHLNSEIALVSNQKVEYDVFCEYCRDDRNQFHDAVHSKSDCEEDEGK